MSTATLAPDYARAATDRAYYDQLIDKAPDNTHRQVEAAVTAYATLHAPAAPRPLDYPGKRILDFAERIACREWRTPGALEQAVRDEFGFSATRYFQCLNALIDQPQALAYAPITVNRLRAVREMRRQARSARRHAERSAA